MGRKLRPNTGLATKKLLLNILSILNYSKKLGNNMTDEQIESNNHIPTAEVEKDLQDTESEIKDFQDELNILLRHPQENKVRIYLLTGNVSIEKEFCEKLKEILEYRKRKIVATEA